MKYRVRFKITKNGGVMMEGFKVLNAINENHAKDAAMRAILNQYVFTEDMKVTVYKPKFIG